jgi:hypothetical protein
LVIILSDKLFFLAIKNFNDLMVICPCLLEDTVPIYSSGSSSSDSFLSLNLDILHFDSDILDISLSHYFLDEGCQIPDPDIKIRIFRNHCVAFPISYLDANIYSDISPSSSLNQNQALSIPLKSKASKIKGIELIIFH